MIRFFIRGVVGRKAELSREELILLRLEVLELRWVLRL